MELVNIYTGVITSVKQTSMLKYSRLTDGNGEDIQTYVDVRRANLLTDENKRDRRIERVKNYAHHFAAVIRRHLNDYQKCKAGVKPRKIDTGYGHTIEYFSSQVNEREQLKWLEENQLLEVLYDRKSTYFTWSANGYYSEMNEDDEDTLANLLNVNQLPKRYILIDKNELAEVKPDRSFTRYSPRHIAKYRDKLDNISICTSRLQAFKEKLDKYSTKLYVVNRDSCKERFCPCCQMFKRREEGFCLSQTIDKIHNKLKKDNDSRILVMLTLTMPNIEIDPSGRNYKPQLIKKAKDKLSKGITKLFRGTRDKHGGYNNPVIGWTVADFETHFECTLATEIEHSGEDGQIVKYYVHPHMHVLALFPADYSEYNPNCFVPIIRNTQEVNHKLITKKWDTVKRQYIYKNITNTCIKYHPNKSLSEMWDECINNQGSIVHIQELAYIGNYLHHKRTQLILQNAAFQAGLVRKDGNYNNFIWRNFYWVKSKQATIKNNDKLRIVAEKIEYFNRILSPKPDDSEAIEINYLITEQVEQELDIIFDNEYGAQWVYKDENGNVEDVENLTIAEADARNRIKTINSGIAEAVKYINKPDTVVKKKKQSPKVRTSKNNPNIQIIDCIDFDIEICKKDLKSKGLTAIEYYIYFFDCLANIPVRTSMGMFKQYMSETKIEKEEYIGKQNMKFTNKQSEVTSQLEKKYFTAKPTMAEEFAFVETDYKHEKVLYKDKNFPLYSVPEAFQRLMNKRLDDELCDP